MFDCNRTQTLIFQSFANPNIIFGRKPFFLQFFRLIRIITIDSNVFFCVYSNHSSMNELKINRKNCKMKRVRDRELGMGGWGWWWWWKSHKNWQFFVSLSLSPIVIIELIFSQLRSHHNLFLSWKNFMIWWFDWKRIFKAKGFALSLSLSWL